MIFWVCALANGIYLVPWLFLEGLFRDGVGSEFSTSGNVGIRMIKIPWPGAPCKKGPPRCCLGYIRYIEALCCPGIYGDFFINHDIRILIKQPGFNRK